MVCGSCHANVSRLSHELRGYTFGLQPGLIQDSGGFCQIVSVKEKSSTRGGPRPTPFSFHIVYRRNSKGPRAHSAALLIFADADIPDTVGILGCNMLFLGNVGQDVRANLPKLRRHMPATGRDLQILQIQFRGPQPILFTRVRSTRKRPEDSPDRASHPDGRRAAGNEYLALLGMLIDTPHPRFWN